MKQLEEDQARIETLIESEAKSLTKTIGQLYRLAQAHAMFAENAESAVVNLAGAITQLSQRTARLERIVTVRLGTIYPGDQN